MESNKEKAEFLSARIVARWSSEMAGFLNGRLWTRIGSLILFVCVGMGLPVFGTSQPSDPQVLVREVIDHEVQMDNADHSHWRYKQRHAEPGKNVVRECVDTKQGTICRRLAEAGHALTPAEQKMEEHRIQNLLNNPAEQRKEQKVRREDGDKALEMLKMLPEAFRYHYDGQEGNLVRLKFEPNPGFNAPNREARVFHCMSGFVWIDPQQRRLTQLKGRLTREVKFGGGLLGHLDSGGTFQVKREDVGSGHWDTTLLDVNIHGKVLFFKSINAEQHEVTEDFQRVPDNLTLVQGASLLGKPGTEAKLDAAVR
jgi:hypothetical protein